MKDLEIRRAIEQDYDSIWNIIQQVISQGDTYVFAPNSSKSKMLNYWCNANIDTYVAVDDRKIVGTFIIKENQPDLGSHVANASFMTLPSASGRGIGKAMANFCLEEARRMGFKSMQFNIVIKNNERAVRLWQNLGFEIVGEIPDAFNHQKLGFISAYIMWKRL